MRSRSARLALALSQRMPSLAWPWLAFAGFVRSRSAVCCSCALAALGPYCALEGSRPVLSQRFCLLGFLALSQRSLVTAAAEWNLPAGVAAFCITGTVPRCSRVQRRALRLSFEEQRRHIDQTLLFQRGRTPIYYKKVPLILGNPNPYNPLYIPNFHFIFHFLFHLILHYTSYPQFWETPIWCFKSELHLGQRVNQKA